MEKKLNYRKIILPYGGMKKMGQDLRFDRTTIEEALRYTRDTDLQNKIREDAVQLYGGKVIEF